MPNYVVQRIQDLLNEHQKSLNGSKVLILGVSYKRNISDQRHSPAIPVGQGLADKGAELSYHDANVPKWQLNGQELESVTDLDSAVQSADIVILLQAHREYDLDDIGAKAKLLFDTRGVTDSDDAYVFLVVHRFQDWIIVTVICNNGAVLIDRFRQPSNC